MNTSDSVLRTCYYKYTHPKEALIENGLLNRGLMRLIESDTNMSNDNTRITSAQSNQSIKPSTDRELINDMETGSDTNGLSFVYPFGATINVVNFAKNTF